MEIEFYAFVPFLSYLRRKVGLNFLLFLFPWFFVVKVILALVANPLFKSSNMLTLLLFHISMMSEFCVGIILYLAYENLANKKKASVYLSLCFASGTALLCGLCVFFVLYGNEGINKFIITRAFFTTFCAVGYALVLLSFLMYFRDKKIKAHKLFLFFGSISYGTYLMHNIFPRLTDRLGIHMSDQLAYVMYSVIVLFVARVGFRYIENPMRTVGRKIAELQPLRFNVPIKPDTGQVRKEVQGDSPSEEISDKP
jgi:peptidoglycan/LPS O-acetylase OafA/YrhL